MSQGFGEGVLRTFKRFQTRYGDKDHFAMNKDGDVALKDGHVYEEKHKPKVEKHQYTFEGEKYKYETRSIRRKTGTVTERQKLLPSIKAIAYYFRKPERVQTDRPTRNAVAGGKRAPPKTAVSPVIIRYPKSFDTVFIDSFRLPVCTHKGNPYSWVFLRADYLTKFIHIAEVHQVNELAPTKESAKESAKQSVKNDETDDFNRENYKPHLRP